MGINFCLVVCTIFNLYSTITWRIHRNVLDSFHDNLIMGSCVVKPIMLQNIKKKNKLIAFEGNIASGKSSILKLLNDELNSSNFIFLHENLNEWDTIRDDKGIPLFEKFCTEPSQFGFKFQVLVLSSQLKALNLASISCSEPTVVIVERSLRTSLRVFARLLESTGKIGS